MVRSLGLRVMLAAARGMRAETDPKRAPAPIAGSARRPDGVPLGETYHPPDGGTRFKPALCRPTPGT